MDLGQIASVVVALTGAIAWFTSYRLGRRGQRKDDLQQAAKNSLETRIAAFDELESINDRLRGDIERLNAEAERLRQLVSEQEAAGNVRLARQAHRCREQLDQMISTVSLLQGVVISEMATGRAGDVIENAMRHIAADHPADDEPDLD